MIFLCNANPQPHSHFICLDTYLVNESYFFIDYVLSLLKFYGIVECSHVPRPNVVSKREAHFGNLPCELDLLQNVMGYFLDCATSYHGNSFGRFCVIKFKVENKPHRKHDPIGGGKTCLEFYKVNSKQIWIESVMLLI